MKLERLEILDSVSTKNIIVAEVLGQLDKKVFYNKYELEIALALVLFTLLGNTELHKEMDREDLDWIGFINDNYKLIEELREGEHGNTYNDIMSEIVRGTEQMMKYNRSIGSVIEDLGKLFTEENLGKIKEVLEGQEEGEQE